MRKSSRLGAEAQFAATQKKGKQAQKEKDKAQQALEEKTARLRALRLAKEAADAEAANKEALGKVDASAAATDRRES